MIFIVNPSPRLSVVRQIAAVKILCAKSAMIAGGLQARAQSDGRTHKQEYKLRVQRDPQLDHSRILAQRSHFFRQDI